MDFAMNAACASASSGGGGSVLVATGWPTRVKNSSCPAGAHRHSSRTGASPALVKACGALAGTLMVWPVRWRPSARRDVHVDEGVPAGGVMAGDQDGVGVADEPDVRQALIFVWPRDGEPARRVVGRDRSRLRRHAASLRLRW